MPHRASRRETPADSVREIDLGLVGNVVLVVGGTGPIGQAIVTRLREGGRDRDRRLPLIARAAFFDERGSVPR
jgi:hypothetical protein